MGDFMADEAMDGGFHQAGRPAWRGSRERPGAGWPVGPGFPGRRGVQPERPGPGSRMSPGDTTSTVLAGTAGPRFVITEIRCGPAGCCRITDGTGVAFLLVGGCLG